MDRTIISRLAEWQKKEGRKPLILKGARQVGKTWALKEFGRRCFKKTAYITFFKNQRMKDVFEGDYNLERILTNINIECKTEVTPEDTLIIFDEIQECPRALEALKYFCEEAPEYAVAAAGSLLGLALHKDISFPVGKVDSMNMYPLSFREFLMAMGENQLAAVLTESDTGLINDFHGTYSYWLKNYMYVGGMPEVVKYFSEHKNYEEVRAMQNQILADYEDDFGKHIPKEQLPKVRLVWNSIPLQLAKENKKFFFGKIKEGARAKDFEEAIELLKDCGLITKVQKVSKPAVPLKTYADFTAFKLYFVDVGLLGAHAGLDASSILDGNKLFVEFKGAITEQYVLQQIVSDTKNIPYYYSGEKATYELDFLIQKNGELVPIEVKAGENLRSKSLAFFREKYGNKTAVRFSLAKMCVQDWLLNLPLYAVARL
ncbi:MAG: ATP-binding protein [Treponema sp.]|nr:ATP-binding protein [Treponema sp.]